MEIVAKCCKLWIPCMYGFSFLHADSELYVECPFKGMLQLTRLHNLLLLSRTRSRNLNSIEQGLRTAGWTNSALSTLRTPSTPALTHLLAAPVRCIYIALDISSVLLVMLPDLLVCFQLTTLSAAASSVKQKFWTFPPDFSFCLDIGLSSTVFRCT
jgi:hypothetical protein